ncbi:MAG: hypothetical protein JWO80_1871, partial [Bryobacterales bacterium]|nr:hypothetical protein [Bryobacterales bacterium]
MRFSFQFVSTLALVFVSGQSIVAQRIALGVELGVRTTEDVSGTLSPESKRYIVGPMVDIVLPMRFSLELDALYRRVGFTGYFSSCCAYSITRERANSWEFPTILKYRLPVVPAHPFVGIGYAPRMVKGTDVSSGSFLSGNYNIYPGYEYFFNRRSGTSYSVTHGVVVSG